MNISTHFNWTAIKTRGTSLLIEHSPCCLLSIAAGSLGISVLNHNPMLELGFAIGGAIIGEHIGHKYFSKNCNHGEGTGLWAMTKRYGIALSFGLATWGIHQAYFHDHDNHEEAKKIAIKCDGPDQKLIYLPHTDHDQPHDHSHEHTHIQVCAFRSFVNPH